MSISVQQLVKTAFKNCSLIGDGESVDGTMAGTTANDGALGLLNNLLAELNNQQYLTAFITSREVTITRRINFVGNSWAGERPSWYILGDPPVKVLGVSRKIGSRWLPLHSCDPQQMATRTMSQLATSWTYGFVKGGDPRGNPDVMMYGRLELDTNRPTESKIFYTTKIEAKALNESLYLNDTYFDLLLNGLCVKLCVKYKLTDYLPMFEQQFKQAKNLIKRSNATQRMLQQGDLGGGYDDSFYNGLGGVGW